MKSKKQLRQELIEARKAYLKDMKWLREEYGIIPKPKTHTIKDALLASLAALEKDDSASLENAVTSFKALHKSVIYQTAWDLLEQTKRAIKAIRESDPSRFEKKRQLWVQASWALSEAGYKRKFARYYDCIKTAVRI